MHPYPRSVLENMKITSSHGGSRPSVWSDPPKNLLTKRYFWSSRSEPWEGTLVLYRHLSLLACFARACPVAPVLFTIALCSLFVSPLSASVVVGGSTEGPIFFGVHPPPIFRVYGEVLGSRWGSWGLPNSLFPHCLSPNMCLLSVSPLS